MNPTVSHRFFFCLSTGLYLLFFVGWFFAIGRGNPEYLQDFHAAVNPDAQTYVQLGENIWREGVYSRNPNQPFRPDFKWTPVYPVLAGAVSCCGGVGAILALNVFLTLASAALLARLVWFYMRSFWGAFLVFLCPLLDPLVWSLNLQAMSDVAFLFFLSLGVFWTFPALFPTELSGEPKAPKLSSVAGGLAFALAILTRPSGLYVPVVLLLAALCGWLFRQKPRWAAVGLMLVGAALPVAGWMARNAAVFGKFALSGNQNIVMVYYTGGGAWQMAEGGTLDEAQKRIEEEFHLPPCVVCHNPEAFGGDPAEIDSRLAAAKRKVLLRYPKDLVLSSGIGVVKSLAAHETRTLEEITHSSGLRAVFVWSMVFQGAMLLLAALFVLFRLPALWRFARQNPAFTLAILGVAAYFLLTMMLSGMDCCARYRLPLMPIVYILAVAPCSFTQIVSGACPLQRRE